MIPFYGNMMTVLFHLDGKGEDGSVQREPFAECKCHGSSTELPGASEQETTYNECKSSGITLIATEGSP